MKFCLKRWMVLFVALAAWYYGECQGRATVSLTVTPSAVGNTYAGDITLNITGLTNGESVQVQTYLDLNSNGVVDAGEPLVDVFGLTDGGASVIGGVTNISVPFDSNSATGAITASLSFRPHSGKCRRPENLSRGQQSVRRVYASDGNPGCDQCGVGTIRQRHRLQQWRRSAALRRRRGPDRDESKLCGCDRRGQFGPLFPHAQSGQLCFGAGLPRLLHGPEPGANEQR